jgi:hypothetical protein
MHRLIQRLMRRYAHQPTSPARYRLHRPDPGIIFAVTFTSR